MIHIKFKYRDACSNWEWSEKELTISTVKEFVDGLGSDCEYEIEIISWEAV